MRENKVVILADGNFPKSSYPLELLYGADTIVCCDNSIVKLLEHTNLMADYIVGDMDSLSADNKIKFKDIIRHSPDQETNDLTKAFNFTKSLNPTKVTILGATGQRDDHTLGNISLLITYQEDMPGLDLAMVTDNGIFTAHSDTFTQNCTKGEQVSIFAFDPTLKIESAGLVYPTDSVIFDLWWKATLNETASTSFTLKFSHPSRVLLYRNLC